MEVHFFDVDAHSVGKFLSHSLEEIIGGTHGCAVCRTTSSRASKHWQLQ
jgi:hypothetical protein